MKSTPTRTPHKPATLPTSLATRQHRQHHIVLRLFLCIGIAGLTLFLYIDKQNDLTELRLAIPALSKEVKSIQEENIRLRYEIERFESPIHLIELMRKPEFSHLKFPYLKDEIFLPKAAPLSEDIQVFSKRAP